MKKQSKSLGFAILKQEQERQDFLQRLEFCVLNPKKDSKEAYEDCLNNLLALDITKRHKGKIEAFLKGKSEFKTAEDLYSYLKGL